MPHLRSRAKAAAASPPSPGGVPQGTPAPSPSTSLRLGLGLGLGPASPADDAFDLKSSAAAPPRRSLHLAAGTPNTPAARDGGGSSGSGSGPGSGGTVRRTGRVRARVSASSPASPSPRDGNSGSDDGWAWTDGASAGGGGGPDGAVPSMSPRSESQIAKRRMEADGEAGPGSSGGGQVHDGMLHRGAGTPTKRPRSILVGGVETVYVTDSESDTDEDCVMLGWDGVKVPVPQVPPDPSGVELNASAMNMDRIEMGGRGAGTPTKRPRSILVGGVETVYVTDSESDTDEDCVMLEWDGVKVPVPQVPSDPIGVELNASAMNMDRIEMGGRGDHARTSNGEPTDNLVQKEVVGGVIEQLAYPVGSASSPEAEMFVDLYCKEDKLVLGNNNSRAGAIVGSQVGTGSCRFGTDSKGKGKMPVEDSLSSLSSSEDEPDSVPVDSKEIQNNSGSVSASASLEPFRKQAARQQAIRLAPKFAFYKADKDEHIEDDDEEEVEPPADPQDWPGPFATAARIYGEREAKMKARELNSSKVDKSANKAIAWSPSKDKRNPFRAAPSLTSLCLNTLAEYSEGIESLGGIPEELKHKLLKILCHSRKMNIHLLNELLCDNPTELHLSECSWLSEDDFEKTFGKCNTDNLQDLQLDISGRCMPDYILPTTLAKAPNCMPLLRKISLKGNYRLSDNGLDTIISAAPSLSSLNLCQCSLLTSSGIVILADKLHLVLRELYIDDCTNVEAMTILPALQKINHLEVLSMSGIQSVCDKFVNELIHVHGSNMKELAFAGCLKLTSLSIKTIGENCPQLISLDLRNLNRLRDSAMRHLRNGCRLIRKLKLQRNIFSDEAMSRYLEESGGCLTELMLNNVEKVGDLTALAISRKCAVRLEALDVSFCRQLTNEALGLIVDSCPSLRILKLFGCTQITNFFLKGHSNTSVKIIGIEGNILEQIDSH